MMLSFLQEEIATTNAINKKEMKYLFFMFLKFEFEIYSPHQTGVVIGTSAGVFGLVDLSLSGYTSLFGN